MTLKEHIESLIASWGNVGPGNSISLTIDDEIIDDLTCLAKLINAYPANTCLDLTLVFSSIQRQALDLLKQLMLNPQVKLQKLRYQFEFPFNQVTLQQEMFALLHECKVLDIFCFSCHDLELIDCENLASALPKMSNLQGIEFKCRGNIAAFNMICNAVASLTNLQILSFIYPAITEQQAFAFANDMQLFAEKLLHILVSGQGFSNRKLLELIIRSCPKLQRLSILNGSTSTEKSLISLSDHELENEMPGVADALSQHTMLNELTFGEQAVVFVFADITVLKINEAVDNATQLLKLNQNSVPALKNLPQYQLLVLGMGLGCYFALQPIIQNLEMQLLSNRLADAILTNKLAYKLLKNGVKLNIFDSALLREASKQAIVMRFIQTQMMQYCAYLTADNRYNHFQPADDIRRLIVKRYIESQVEQYLNTHSANSDHQSQLQEELIPLGQAILEFQYLNP